MATASDGTPPPVDMGEIKGLVATNTPCGAWTYYQTIGKELGLSLHMLVEATTMETLASQASPQTTVDDILVFLGYRGLSAHDLEVEPPARLMPPSKAAFDALAGQVDDSTGFKANLHWNDFQDSKVIAVRYFSPKVGDYTSKRFPPKAGWRKLVRLTARPGSQAATKGIGAGYVLFSSQVRPPENGGAFGITDIFPTRATKDGAGLFAPVVQMILERAYPADGRDLPSLYFLTFDGRTVRTKESGIQGVPYGLLGELRANFDLPEVNGKLSGKYYVPESCSQCHGKGFTKPQQGYTFMDNGPYASKLWLNYLDTDQWYDARDADFRSLIAYGIPVLIDMTPSQSDARRRAAFDRFYQMNLFIRAQNAAACGATPCQSLQYRAVGKWLAIHATDPGRQSIWKRVLTPRKAGNYVWERGDPNDRGLLPMLDQYCTRCHLNMFFSVFDKQSVVNQASEAVRRLKLGADLAHPTYEAMPQGRELEGTQREVLIKYLERLDKCYAHKCTQGSAKK